MNRDGGVINLDKPATISSAGAVGRIKHLLRGSRLKVGHAGTLDPFATGVLLILVGRATKCSDALMNQPKRYHAVVHLGATSATDDPDSPAVATPGATPRDRADVAAALDQMTGHVLQQPPIYSALKVGGRRAYKLARGGEEVRLEPRRVFIEQIDLLHYAWPTVTLSVHCGRGTYIRAIARDLGEKLGVGGYLTGLRRTAVGRFDAEQAVTLDRVLSEGVEAHLQPPLLNNPTDAAMTQQ